ncbi:hypothetical protein CA598_26965 [Paenibacillus sp. VTT E-133291]|uniref:hypothetical protein n=2 Tax=Paenibacillus TaxID=44249 RepID=UPI000BA00FA1|nr:hypothetical protein [Paenibacillus sp. PastF-3]OZQ81161.1 hypothetical protein CA598_26965 [Paenibacillus sp. VTT E-133291]
MCNIPTATSYKSQQRRKDTRSNLIKWIDTLPSLYDLHETYTYEIKGIDYYLVTRMPPEVMQIACAYVQLRLYQDSDYKGATPYLIFCGQLINELSVTMEKNPMTERIFSIDMEKNMELWHEKKEEILNIKHFKK